ncbi:CXXC motif containing zinc binding protein-like [Vespa mandarinia]|uniref:Uncharacterized protein n=1 Tax=Vespula squamosa TaxID=30214 RepID=A0ABD2BYP2_VESSQ|nr:CXXC motif containing zinc binding protein-like [Vespa mandarinia]XP_046829156.1 CXXC motif containing zinc binding protein [Vespa crabro]XP_047366616.1 CXXC motif containing zinc binding protein [Vespa velutina]
MVKIALKIKVLLENIEELKSSGLSHNWYFKFKCCNCGEITKKWCSVSLEDSIPSTKGNAVNHFLAKCKLCGRENSMTIVEDSIKSFTAEDQGRFKKIVILDCRGLEPCDFSAREGWIAKAIDNGTEFTDVDLYEYEWIEYCEKIKKPVGITEIEHRFERVK